MVKYMGWSFWLILIPTVCYALAAAVYAYNKNWPMVFAYSGYTWANFGFLWLDIIMRKTQMFQ